MLLEEDIYDDYLKHYGVLGMKWGVRRARKKNQDYEYHSRTTKKYARKSASAKEQAMALRRRANDTNRARQDASKYYNRANKLDRKSETYRKRMLESGELDRRQQNIAISMTNGRAFASYMLMGGLGTKKYIENLAYGDSAAKSFIKSSLTMLTPYNSIRKAMYIRQGER